MQTHLRPVLDDVWNHHRTVLKTAISESVRHLENVLRLDDYHRHGHKEENLEKVVGDYGSESLDLSSLSDVLSHKPGSRSMPDKRRERIANLVETMKGILEACSTELETYPSADFSENEEAIHEKAEAHLNRIANIFKLLRIAQLEIRSKYHNATHDPLFEDFNWRRLSPAELSMCPPFLIFARIEADSGPQLRKMMALLESRKPFKITATRTCLRKTYSPTADPSLPASLSIETIPMAMRGIHFLQTCPAVEGFEKRLFDALSSPRPGLISYLGHEEGENEDAFLHRTGKAVRSRAFPVVLYDPDISPDFVSCFDLAGNPDLEAGWATDEDPNAKDEHGSLPYTFADFAASQPQFASEFSTPGPDLHQDTLTPITEYIEYTRRQRIGKQPVVKLAGIGQEARFLIASHGVVTQTFDQLHLWKTLQELSGINNPHVQTTRMTLNAEFGVQQKALLESLQEEMEKKQSAREHAAVNNAVRNIVANLTGVDPGTIQLD